MYRCLLYKIQKQFKQFVSKIPFDPSIIIIKKGCYYIMRKEKTKLTGREMDILNILWVAENPLIASDIAKEDETLTINTVQATLRKLLQKQLIEVADIVYSGTVLTRSYRPTDASKSLALEVLSTQLYNMKKMVSAPKLIAAYLNLEKDSEAKANVISQLEDILANSKE